jgi:hypothetical protein
MEDQSDEYVVIPSEAFAYLPKEWREQVHALREEGEAVLAVADEDLDHVIRLAKALPTMASLRYIHHRLASIKFEASTEWMMETEMLTSAFVVTYARLMEGGNGSGVARSALPKDLRETHDALIEMRNTRFAHNSEHHSVNGDIEIGFENGEFDINLKFRIGFHIGGALEWGRLVRFLDEMMYNRIDKLVKRLSEKTGRVWRFPHGPAPNWAVGDQEGERLIGEPDAH